MAIPGAIVQANISVPGAYRGISGRSRCQFLALTALPWFIIQAPMTDPGISMSQF